MKNKLPRKLRKSAGGLFNKPSIMSMTNTKVLGNFSKMGELNITNQVEDEQERIQMPPSKYKIKKLTVCATTKTLNEEAFTTSEK